MATELIPVIDLRFLSQSEIATLANSSTNAFNLSRCDDVVVPKIDLSVFNESAGSRKQTYSRINLAPPKSDSPSLPRRRGRPRSIPLHDAATDPSTSAPLASDDSPNDRDRRENLLIASFLRKIFFGESTPPQTKTISTVCANENNDSWKCILAVAEEAQKAMVLAEDPDREILNSKGVAVDLIALGRMEDPFGEELRRRTLGLTTEEQLLGFLSVIEGQWGSRRKRRRFVDASLFGDVLPSSWKLLIGLRRKEGVAWLDCRRYISPNGQQFMSCKEVSSYILSLQSDKQPASDQDDNNTPEFDKVACEPNAGHIHQSSISNGSSSFSSPTPVSCISGNPEKPPEGSSVYYATPISYISCENKKQQPLTAHQRRAKRRKLGKTFVDGVIIKDGKFECQFCHKIFSERHRYNGHIGAHVRYQRLNAELLVDERKITDQTSWTVVPYASSHHNANDSYTLLNGPEAETITVKPSDGDHLKVLIDEGIPRESKCNVADCPFPFADDLNTNLKGSSPTVVKEASPSEDVDGEVNDCINHCEEGIDAVKPKVPQATALSIPLSKSFIMSPGSAQHNGASDPKDADSPNVVNFDGESCDVEEVLKSLASSDADNNTYETTNESGFSLSPCNTDAFEKSECQLINYTAQNTASPCDRMDVDPSSCYDLSLSVDRDSTKDKNDGISPPINLASEFVKFDDKLMEDLENQLFSLSAKDISTYNAEEHDDAKPELKDGQDGTDFLHQLFDKDAVFASGIPCTLQISSDFSTFSDQQIHGIGEDMDCALGADMNSSTVHNIDKPINELEFFFGGSNSAHDENAGDELIENDAERKAVDIGLCTSSWLQFGGEGEGELEKISHRNKNSEDFERSRLGAIEPSDFALFTGQDSKTELEDNSCSSFQLDWNISLGNAGSSGSFTSICVWCSTVFSQGPSNDGFHSEALGFICPACKEKF